MNKIKKLVLLIFSILYSFNIYAFNWDKTYIQSSYGGDYKITTKKSRGTFTISDSSSWKFGENYFFIEAADFVHDELLLYGEFDPSLSLGKIFNTKVGAGPIVDTLITTRFYADELNARETDYGLMWYWDFHRIFQYVSTKIVYRKVLNVPGNAVGLQLNSQINIHKYIFSTIFVDWTPKSQSLAHNRGKNLFGRIELFGDVGSIIYRPYHIYLGCGFSYWRNKLGVQGTHERVLYGVIRFYI